MFRINWKSSAGQTGHGEYIFTKEVAEEMVRQLNIDLPTINHWIEEPR